MTYTEQHKVHMKKAITATVDLGFTSIEGLLLPCGTYGIAAPQLMNLFNPSSTANGHASRDLKAILGASFPTAKYASDLNSRPTYVLTLEQVGLVALELAFEGNKEAVAFCRVANIEYLRRRFNTAFEVLQTESEHNAIAKLLYEHSKQFHPLLTSWWKRDLCGEEPHKFYYSNRVNQFKKANGLRVVSIREYSQDELCLLNQRESMYHAYRLLGMKHKACIEKLTTVI